MTSLVKLNKKELEDMAYLMSNAFLFHENFLYLIPNEKRRKKATLNIFLMMYKVINKYGYIFVVEEDNKNVGYITFMDESKSTMSFMNVLKTKGIRNFLKFLYYVGMKDVWKFITYLKVFKKLNHSSNDKAIHLYSTGIEKEFRGKGLMRVAFTKSFDYLKDLGYSKIELETSDSSNLSIYEKMGFLMTQRVQSKNKNQTIWFFELHI